VGEAFIERSEINVSYPLGQTAPCYTPAYYQMGLNLKRSHAKVRDYFDALNQFGQLNISHETAVRQAFASLLDTCARQFKWKLVQEFRIPTLKNKSVIVDGVILDAFTLKHGFWEAKDLKDQLEREIKKKFEQGYPRNNIVFQSPARAVLYQKGLRVGLNEDITKADNLVELLKCFFDYREPQHEEWETAVAEFSGRIPEIATAVKAIIEKERQSNKNFVASFDAFVTLCRQAINPNLSDESVETMLIQHLLTERIFRRVFNNPEFTRRNIIAAEIEKVINSLTSKHFSRDAFLQDLDRFYRAIEVNAENATDFSEKQSFLNTVYERFFQGFSPKEADTHGIVYTPQPIVNFMVRSVEGLLHEEFGKSLSDSEVHILDPFVGTGNFIVRIMQEIQKTRLKHKYENELHCNEIMLLPYYIASMNIEHAYLNATGEYKPFEGICLVDTFELAEASQPSLFTADNTTRVERQKRTPIFVAIGNPPYNSRQLDEDDKNKNRKYPVLDKRISSTYRKDSTAGLTIAVADPYVKAIRWASDRIRNNGIVVFVTNNSFIDQVAFDGMRKHLERDFDSIYLLDLRGNVRHNPKLSGTIHNVFGIQVGVSINFLIRKREGPQNVHAGVRYFSLGENWTKEERYDFLDANSVQTIPWRRVDRRGSDWSLDTSMEIYGSFVPLGTKESKSFDESGQHAIFRTFSNGVKTNRDAWMYNAQPRVLGRCVSKTIDTYNAECIRWKTRSNKKASLDEFVVTDPRQISWSGDLKSAIGKGKLAEFDSSKIRRALYRPFYKSNLYFDRLLNNSIYLIPRFFPTGIAETENIAMCATGTGAERPFATSVTRIIPDLNFYGPGTVPQWFPFYTYDKEGSNRQENITDWALDQFRSHYGDQSITKRDIFHYTYAVLHHLEYRTRYAANLKRELPRIPYAPEFHSFAEIGKCLTELHADYEKQKEYPLVRMEKTGHRLDLRVEKMRLGKTKETLLYNDFLTLSGVPKEAYNYRLGNRSALEWVIDQYQVSTDTGSGIVDDPNREDDPEYILNLISQVITISLETVKLVNAMPDLGLPKAKSGPA
jgi:predicted helicase